MSVRIAEKAGQNLGDALADGARDGFRDARRFVSTVRDDPASLVSDNTRTRGVELKQYAVIQLFVGYVWWQFILDDDQNFGAIDALSIVYVTTVIWGVIR